MKPSDEFTAKVRARIIELTGSDPGGAFVIRDIFPGTDPATTEDQMIEAVAQSLSAPRTGSGKAPESGRPPISVRALIGGL